MNSIERAIESAEVRLRNAEYLLSISHGSDETIARKRNKVEICRVTLEALREQSERSNPNPLINADADVIRPGQWGKCPNCGKVNRCEYHFCANCGIPICPPKEEPNG